MQPPYNLSRDAFVGTARYYADYRPPYPASLLEDLRRRAGIPAGARLLDLGCGPGRVAIALAPHFSEVWAVDQEQEMIEVGIGRGSTLPNIRWLLYRVEELQAPVGYFDLVTIGEAFHRFEQRLVTKRSYQWLRPGCCIAILWQISIWQGTLEWQRLASEVMSRYTPVRLGGIQMQENPSFEEVLRDGGFQDISTRLFHIDHTWTTDTLIGYMYSTSILSRRSLGDRAEAFETELRRALLGYDRSGRYQEEAAFGYLLGRRPGSLDASHDLPNPAT